MESFDQDIPEASQQEIEDFLLEMLDDETVRLFTDDPNGRILLYEKLFEDIEKIIGRELLAGEREEWIRTIENGEPDDFQRKLDALQSPEET